MSLTPEGLAYDLSAATMALIALSLFAAVLATEYPRNTVRTN